MNLTDGHLDKDGILLLRKMFRKASDRKSQTIVALCDNQLRLLEMLARYREAFENHDVNWFVRKK